MSAKLETPSVEAVYKSRTGSETRVKIIIPKLKNECMTISNGYGTFYVESPESLVIIEYPDGGVDHHLVSDHKLLKKFLFDWSGIWGANLWNKIIEGEFLND